MSMTINKNLSIMKVTKYFIAAAALLTSLTACNSDIERVTYNPGSSSKGELTASETDIRLTAATTKQEVLTLSWGKSDFGVPVAITYTVQMDTRGGDFTNAYTLAATSDTEVTLTGKDLNSAVIELQKLKNPDKEPSYDEQKLDIRVSSTFSEDVNSLISNVVAMNVTPYAGKLEYAKMSVPGGHNGWNVTDYTQALYATNTSTPNVYEGYIYMGAGNEFKVTLGSWDAGKEWGSSDMKTLEPSGANMKVDEAGCYYIVADLDNLTIKVEKRDWSLVGSAIEGDESWGTDLDLEYDSDNNIYRVTYDFKYGGEFKFRANHSWDINYGKDPDGEEGDLALNGGNITPLPGEYTVALSFADGYPVFRLFAGADVSEFAYLSLPGTMNGWAADTKDNVVLDMTKSGTYTGWIYASGDDEFKIADGSWDDNWGSSDFTTLVPGGDNIKPEAGMYLITVNINELTMSLQKTTWSIIGSAVAGDTSWGTDYDLEWNAESKVFEGTFKLEAGEWKFRANKDWAINFGGNGEAGGLAQDGSNFAIDEAGTYIITLDMQTTLEHTTPTYSITKQ